MGRAKKTRKFGLVKRMIGRHDQRIKEAESAKKALQAADKKTKGAKEAGTAAHHVEQTPSNLFFNANTALGPPYHVIVDTNFINHSLRNKLDLLSTMMDLLYAKCIPTVTDCTIAELEKLGDKYRLALRVAKDERWQRLRCLHKGTYADDCIVDHVTQNRIYIVGTNDKDLARRLRKIRGVPVMKVGRGKYAIEGMPDAMKR